MLEQWLSLEDIPAQGREFALSDPSMWSGAWEAFKLPFTITSALEASVTLMPQDEGVLVRGSITGELTAPCDRCVEPAVVRVNVSFDEYEEYPPEPEPVEKRRKPKKGGRRARNDSDENRTKAKVVVDEDATLGDEGLVRLEKGEYELNIAALLWEQLMLVLPVKPLCKPDCKGVCLTCGVDLNKTSCDCQKDEGDPRMAVLRNLKISK